MTRCALDGRTGPTTLAVALAAICCLFGAALADPPPAAVGGLYLENSDRYLCTATVVSGLELGLREARVVLTAAHCVTDALEPGDDGRGWTHRYGFLLRLDDAAYRVVPTRVGYPLAGYDLALLTFADAVPEVAPLQMGSWDAVDFGSEVRNFANPLGMGLQYFSGSVTMLRLEASPHVRNSRGPWRDNAVAELQVGPGSSGSLILDGDLDYIGVLSGVIDPRFGSAFTVFVPQWKFDAFLRDDRAARDVNGGDGAGGDAVLLALAPEARAQETLLE